jgi:hypothetical protein
MMQTDFAGDFLQKPTKGTKVWGYPRPGLFFLASEQYQEFIRPFVIFVTFCKKVFVVKFLFDPSLNESKFPSWNIRLDF